MPEEELPKPPAGRRSSSRPAGPPAPVVFNPGTPAPEPKKPARTNRAKKTESEPVNPEGSVATEPAVVDGAETEAPVSAPRSTNRKSTTTTRKTTVKASTDGPAKSKDVVEEAVPVPEPEATLPVSETAEPTGVAAPRQRAPRKRPVKNADPKDAEVQPEPAVITEPEVSPTQTAEPLEGISKQTPRRRTRGSKPANPTSPQEVTTEESSAVVADEVEAALATAKQQKKHAAPKVSDDQGKTEALESLAAALASDFAQAESSPEEGESTDGESSEIPSRPRRRRRRGGRRRRRNPDGELVVEEAEQDSEDVDDVQDVEDNVEDSDDDSDDEVTEGGTRRRRRRRRRRGEDLGGSDDDPSDVVIRVRDPRSRAAVPASDEVTGIEGSTRMEAKRQRRKEGRSAGRRRSPILTEAEFLARRESVDRVMVIRQKDEYTQLAVLEDGILVEHYVDKETATSLIGNVYLGRIQNVLPSMEAAFIDIGRGRNAVLYAGEVNWDSFDVTGSDRKIEDVLKSGQSILVQVTKDPVGAKGARLTGHISLPGRYVVYSPDGHLSGVSRKLSDAERNRLKSILGDAVADDASAIVRTAAEGASEEDLVRDVERLKAQWEVIEKKSKQGSAPQVLYSEPDLTVRIVRDLFTEDFANLVIVGNGGPDDAYENIKGYVDHVAPHLESRMTRWDTAEQGDPFAQYRIDEQIAKALERKVFLPSGGSLVIDRTEAMTVIDVNTGKFTGTGGNLEETVTKNNLEAAEEIVRQLRLRDLGGIVMIDFIDMVLPQNRELLLRRLVECLGRDRTRHQVSEVTSLGLVQLTRKKVGTGLAEAFTEQCECCGGRGYRRYEEPVDSQAPADGGERKHSKKTGN